MAGAGVARRNYVLDLYIAGFFFDQVLGLYVAFTALRAPDILFFLTPFRLISVAVGGLALVLTLQVVLRGLDKKLLVLPVYHLGGLAAMEGLTFFTLDSPWMIGASLLHPAVGLAGGAFWLYWTQQIGSTVKLRPVASPASPSALNSRVQGGYSQSPEEGCIREAQSRFRAHSQPDSARVSASRPAVPA